MKTRPIVSSTQEVDEGYDAFEKLVANRVNTRAGSLFTTDADPEKLWNLYLSNLPEDRRQHYNCHCCRKFIQKYGGLVYIDQEGKLSSFLWYSNDVPAFFSEAIGRMQRLVERAKVTGVFFSSDKIWGNPQTGNWTHLAGTSCNVFTDKLKTAEQVMAEKKEEYGMLCHGLADYSVELVTQAVRVLKADAVRRSEKALGIGEWFLALHEKLVHLEFRGNRRSNIIWLAVATAPPGFCHIRSTMISTLLDDLQNGVPFETVQRRWAEKMHPLQYQRPTALPSEGSIEVAEKLVEKLGCAKSLERRFARLDEVPMKLWIPPTVQVEETKSGGVFDSLREKKVGTASLELPPTKMTWEKFARTILPTALAIETSLSFYRGPFYGLVTAVDSEAPPIIQWDGLEGQARNPVSWYFYPEGSTAEQWNLPSNLCYAQVTAIFTPPNEWQSDKFKHFQKQVFFALGGCWDKNGDKCGLGLFPENMKSEFHGIRSVIEAYSRKGGIKDPQLGTANGLAFSNGSTLTLRVTDKSGSAIYVLDRWDG